MNLKQWGEKGVIEFLSKTFKGPAHVTGIGDDCAVIPINQTESMLVTVDALVEGVHFLSAIDPKDLGYKSVMVNVSDIASMGGTPEYLFVAGALPNHLDACWVKSFFEGFKEACDETGTFVLGGDTTGSQTSIFLSITAIGKAKNDHIKYRSQAKSGDYICVTGDLGESAAGLKCLLENVESSHEVNQVIKSHLRPRAHFKEGAWLAEHSEVHAMIDISDGISQDIKNIMNASQCGAIIDIDNLPISSIAKKVSLLYGWDYQTLALSGGEEYSLLLTLSASSYNDISEKFEKVFGRTLSCIGEITGERVLKYLKDDEFVQINPETFNHFKD